jgi:hypothetical protein
MSKTKSTDNNKTMALSTNVPTVKSPPLSATTPPPLPAKPPPARWKDFDAFAADADELVELKLELQRDMAYPNHEDARASGDLEDLEGWCQRLVTKCEEGIERFNPSENSDDDGVIKKSVVSKRLSILIGSFPNAVPHSAEAYTRMLVEEVAAFDELDAIILESACREIARTCKFAPSISEVLEVLKNHNERWDNRYRAIWYTSETLAKAIAAREKWEAEQKVTEAEQKRRQAERKRKEARKEWEQKLDVARLDLEKANKNVGFWQSMHQRSIAEADKKAAELAELETLVAAELAKLDADEATATKQNSELP